MDPPPDRPGNRRRGPDGGADRAVARGGGRDPRRCALGISTSALKADRSPVTDADERSQAILLEAAARLLPGVAVVSEEMASRPSRLGDVFVLIDPLDGTKEYVAGSSEYTVNLAIVRRGAPVAGFVAVPAEGLIYRGVVGARRRAPRDDA